ncbi:hypothetical protein LCGC14_1440820 [marine sediment metagenome]|uniref:Uncharacterized protein n=1 Tax=marine sediment metagenome TaxID=412755 RepID=A0A0F9JKR2_9ZZZZ
MVHHGHLWTTLVTFGPPWSPLDHPAHQHPRPRPAQKRKLTPGGHLYHQPIYLYHFHLKPEI